MTKRRGYLRAFLAGVAVALLGAGGVGFFVYKTIQAKLSSPALRQTAEEKLFEATSHPVSIGDASLDLAKSMIVFRNVGISVEGESFVNVERIEARAENLVDLQQRRFVELTVTKPKISLQRKGARWNLESFLAPILEKLAAVSVAEATAEAGEKPDLPIDHIQVTEAELTVALEEAQVYSGVRIKNLDLRRTDSQSPWTVVVADPHIRLNPSQGEWPLLEVADVLKALLGGREEEDEPDSDSSESPLEALGTVAVENLSLQLIHPQHEFKFDGFSFEASQFFELIRAQTGTLEKKNLNSAT